MRVLVAVWLLLTCLFVSSAAEEWTYDKYISEVLRGTDSVHVILDDKVLDGCWTNSYETKLLFERELKKSGIVISEDGQLTVTLFAVGHALTVGDVKLGCVVSVTLISDHFAQSFTPNGSLIEDALVLSFYAQKMVSGLDVDSELQKEVLILADEFSARWLNGRVL